LSASDNMTQTQDFGDLLTLLCCPVCRGSLVNQDSGFSCPSCGKRFPEVRGVVRFVDEDNYADSFGYQWQPISANSTGQCNRNLSERDFVRKTGLKPQDLKGKLVLECGLRHGPLR